jgi:tetratricopeptide (TPR) repeat protein
MSKPNPSAAGPSSLARRLPLIILGLGAIALALWLTVFRKDTPPADPRPATPTNPTAANPLADLPDSLRASLDQPTASVKVLADIAGKDPTKFPALAAQLPSRPLPGDAPQAPRAVTTLAEALAAKRLGPDVEVASFERVMLLGALYRTADLTPRYGYVRGARFAASELLARTFAVRTADDAPWQVLPGDGAPGAPVTATTLPADHAEIVRLGDADVVAMGLAFRAMGEAANRNLDEASRLVGFARRVRAEDPVLVFLAGRLEFASDLGPIARRSFDRAVALEQDAMSHFLLGRFARIDERPVDAVAAFTKAAELDPTFGEPHVELAEMALERLDVSPRDQHPTLHAEARRHIAAARKANPKAQGLRLVEAHLVALGADREGIDPAAADPAQAAARHAEAVRLIREETELHPHIEGAWMLLAQVHASAEEDAEAIAALERARTVGRETGETANALGQLLAATGRFDDALVAFDRALRLDPSIVELRPQIASIRRQKGDMEGARRLLAEQMQRFPDDRISSLLAAQLELDEKRAGPALVLLDRVLKQDPKDSEALMLKHIAMLVDGKDGAATETAAREAAGGYRKLAEVLLSQGMRKEAEPLLEKGLEAEPDDLLIPVMLVALHTVAGRLEQAGALREKTLGPLGPEDRAELNRLFDEATAEAMKATGGAAVPTP